MSVNHALGNSLVAVVAVVAKYNKPMEELLVNLQTYLPDAINVAGSMEDAARNGRGIYEALAISAPRLADALHDFIYQIAVPYRSIASKDIAREQLARDLFGL